MKCKKCNSYFEGKVCINCGTPAWGAHLDKRNEKPREDKRNPAEFGPQHRFRLFGFRSRRPWKMILSGLHLCFWTAFLIHCVTTPRYPALPERDYWLSMAENVVFWLIVMLPYIFLSESPIRDHLPLFKKRKFGASFAGLVIVSIALCLLGGELNSMHSAEYQADNDQHSYELVESREATCQRDGKLEYQCTFCGDTETEWIDALGHNIPDGQDTCTRCGERD